MASANRRSSWRLLTLLVAPCTFASCQEPPGATEFSDAWRARSDSVEWHELALDPTACTDCISLTEVLSIGQEDGPGYYEGTRWAAIDTLGRYWVAQSGGPKLYDRTGAFIAQVGRSGEGPLEFKGPGPLYMDADSRVHIFDPENARESVVDLQGRLLREFKLPGWVFEAEPLPTGADWKITNMRMDTPDLLAVPMHVVHADSVVSSMGLNESGMLAATTLRQFAVDSTGLVFSGKQLEYAIDIWHPDGRRITGIRHRGLWDPPPNGKPRPLSRGTLPQGRLQAIRMDGNGRLWVASWVPRADWEKYAGEVELPNGAVMLRPGPNETRYRMALDVIDLDAGRIVARGQFDQLFTRFFDDRTAFGDVVTEEGAPRLVVWRIDFSHPQSNGEEK